MLIGLSALTNGRIAASGGCAPVFKGDEMVGAYGISGGTSQQDEEMAKYALAKTGWAQGARARHHRSEREGAHQRAL